MLEQRFHQLPLLARGVTLVEILTAAVLAGVVLFGLVMMESGRFRMEREILSRSGFVSDQSQVGLATVQMAQRIAAADRFNVDPAGGVYQFRVPVGCMGAGAPPPSCFDIAANYQWEQYRLNGTALRWYNNTGAGCGTMRVVAGNVAALSFAYQDQAPPPPGLDGAVQDNNLLAYAVTWDNGLPGAGNRTHQFTGSIASRAIPYSDVSTTATDSGLGLAPGGVSSPPAPCP